MPPKNEVSEVTTRTDEGETEGKAFTAFLLLRGNGGNEDDLIPLSYELDKRAATLSPRGKVLDPK